MTAHDPDTLEGRSIIRLPVLKQIIQQRIQLLLWWVPRLQQVVINLYAVDGIDGSIGVRVCGKKHSLRVRKQLDRFFQEIDAAHMRHSLIDDEQRRRIAASL